MNGIPEIKDCETFFKELIESADDKELIKKTAETVKELLESTFEIQNEISFHTCIKCPEPCCSVANIWYDVKDLIFIAALGLSAPLDQPRTNSDTCIYFSPFKGCKIERIARPFICNYYICGIQKKYLRKYERFWYEKLNSIFIEIKTLRKYMEEEFLRIKREKENK